MLRNLTARNPFVKEKCVFYSKKARFIFPPKTAIFYFLLFTFYFLILFVSSAILWPLRWH